MESNPNSYINGDLTSPAKPPRTVVVFRRGISLRRRRVLPRVQLGGKKPRRGFLLVRVVKRLKIRWMKLKNWCTLKKLKNHYCSILSDVAKGGESMEAFQQRLLMETSFAIPVMGLSFNA